MDQVTRHARVGRDDAVSGSSQDGGDRPQYAAHRRTVLLSAWRAIGSTAIAGLAPGLFSTSAALAQPSGGQPSRGTQQGEAPRIPGWERIDQSIELLNQAYAARSGGESFEAAARRVSAAQQGQMRDIVTPGAQDMANSRSGTSFVAGARVTVAAGEQNVSASGLNRSQREAVVGGTVGSVGMAIRTNALAQRGAIQYTRNVIETLSREPGLDPVLAERARELANSAVDIAEYHDQQTQQDVTLIERRIEETEVVSELTTTSERAGVFRDHNSTDPFSIQVGDIFLEIDANGAISYTGPDPEDRRSPRVTRDAMLNLRVQDSGLISVTTGPGRGGMPSQANIERTRAYLRSLGPDGAAALQSFERELERIRTRPPRRGGGAAGGGAGRGGASRLVEGDTPDPSRERNEASLEALEAILLERAARELARQGLTLRDNASGPPFIVRQFLAGGRVLEVLELVDIYASYSLQNGPLIVRSGPSSTGTGPSTIMRTPSSAGRSPSSVGTSLSSAGTSLSSAGRSLSSVGTSLSSVGSSPSAVWWSGSAAGTNTGSLVWTSPAFWQANGISSASDWTDPNRRVRQQRADQRPHRANAIPEELCGR